MKDIARLSMSVYNLNLKIMKELFLEKMENLEGGGPADGVITAVDVACVGVGVLGVAGAFFSFGATLAAGAAIAGAWCTGWGVGHLITD